MYKNNTNVYVSGETLIYALKDKMYIYTSSRRIFFMVYWIICTAAKDKIVSRQHFYESYQYLKGDVYSQ